MQTEDLWFLSCWSLSCFDGDTCVILKKIPAIVKNCNSKILNNAPYISDYLGYGYPYQYNSGPSASTLLHVSEPKAPCAAGWFYSKYYDVWPIRQRIWRI